MIQLGKGIPEIEKRKRAAKDPPMLAIAVEDEPAPPPAAEPEPPMEAEPIEEAGEYADKFTADIAAAGVRHGLDAEQSKAFTADVLDALSKCLRGEVEPAADYDTGGMEMEGAAE